MINPPTESVSSRTSAIPKDVPVCRGNPHIPQDRSDFNVYRYARSGRKVTIGPMPVVEFLNEFLPPMPTTRPMPRSLRAFSGVSGNPKNDKAICDCLVDAINRGKRCPSVSFLSTADASEDPSSVDFKPSICGYSHADVHLMTGGATPNLGLAELFFVVSLDHDPFRDSHPHNETDFRCFFAFENREYQDRKDVDPGRSEKRNFGHCVGNAVEACLRQHRCFYFSVLVVGTRARLFRWDRAGAIVTKAFDFRYQPELMCEFLWRFHLADPVQRGFDPTVSSASQTEEVLFKSLIRKHAAFQVGISEDDSEKLDGALSEHYESGKVMKVGVYERGHSKPEYYLVSVPLTCPKSISGHSTRAYWAVKLTGGNAETVCFLKDSWRLDFDSMRNEGSIYEEMEGVKVENICDLECYGDVPVVDLNDVDDAEAYPGRCVEQSACEDEYTVSSASAFDPRLRSALAQRSRTQEFLDAYWVCECLRDHLIARVSRHIHSRVVLKQAGYSLRTFNSSRELFGAAQDGLQALDSAYQHCGRVHRDISLDNIILYRPNPSGPRKGLVVDWEFSTVVDSSGQAVDDLRPGTWAFMSGNALYGLDDSHHTIQDDLESLFYVLMYGSIRWLPHNHIRGLGRWMLDFFDETFPRGVGQTIGGMNKLLQIASRGRKFLELFSFENCYVQDWFNAAYKLLGTTSYASKTAGEPCLWTVERLRELTAAVYDGLVLTDDTECDRIEHDLEGYVSAYRGTQDTQISLFAAARNFRIIHMGPEVPCKRSTHTEEDNESNELSESGRRSGKRRRIDRRAVDVTGRRRDVKRRNTKHGEKCRTRTGSPRIPQAWDNGLENNGSHGHTLRTRASSSLGTRRSPRLQAKSSRRD